MTTRRKIYLHQFISCPVSRIYIIGTVSRCKYRRGALCRIYFLLPIPHKLLLYMRQYCGLQIAPPAIIVQDSATCNNLHRFLRSELHCPTTFVVEASEPRFQNTYCPFNSIPALDLGRLVSFLCRTKCSVMPKGGHHSAAL